jgi:dTDP-glucose pyrophosphorylase
MNTEPVLVILAAGLGSRYGGLKQIDVVGNNGESIIDFSIYDAYRAGFRKVVLIIRKEHEELFDEHIANQIRPYMEVEYAYQDVKNLPAPYTCPPGRTKPWGTTQALLATRGLIHGPFMVINADDFYGREAYQIMHQFLSDEIRDDHYGMVGYMLNNTLTDNGSVTRGVCDIRDGYLTRIVETQKIERVNGKPYSINPDGTETALPEGLVSMNFWGFTPAIYDQLEPIFSQFLSQHIDEPKSEHVIPTAIGQLIDEGRITVKVMQTSAEWFGVTYPQDKDTVVRRIAACKVAGEYPYDLWP